MLKNKRKSITKFPIYHPSSNLIKEKFQDIPLGTFPISLSFSMQSHIVVDINTDGDYLDRHRYRCHVLKCVYVYT